MSGTLDGAQELICCAAIFKNDNYLGVRVPLRTYQIIHHISILLYNPQTAHKRFVIENLNRYKTSFCLGNLKHQPCAFYRHALLFVSVSQAFE